MRAFLLAALFLVTAFPPLVNAEGAAESFAIDMMGETLYPGTNQWGEPALACKPGPDGGPILGELHLDGCYFAPRDLVVHVGDTLVFRNPSMFTPHKATAFVDRAGVRPIDTGPVQPGEESEPFIFETAYNYHYHCALHPDAMPGGTITVLP